MSETWIDKTQPLTVGEVAARSVAAAAQSDVEGTSTEPSPGERNEPV